MQKLGEGLSYEFVEALTKTSKEIVVVMKYEPGITLKVYREFFRGEGINEKEFRTLIKKVVELASQLQERGIAAKRFSWDNLVIIFPEHKSLVDHAALNDPYTFYTDTLVDTFNTMTLDEDLDPSKYIVKMIDLGIRVDMNVCAPELHDKKTSEDVQKLSDVWGIGVLYHDLLFCKEGMFEKAKKGQSQVELKS